MPIRKRNAKTMPSLRDQKTKRKSKEVVYKPFPSCHPLTPQWAERHKKIKSYWAYDVETTSKYPYKKGSKVFAYVFTDEKGNSTIKRENELGFKAFCQTKFNDLSEALIAHNLKFEIAYSKKMGIKIPEEKEMHDTMIMWQILRNLAPSHALDQLAFELCGWSPDLDKKIKKMGEAYGGYHRIPINKMNIYQKADGERTMILFLTAWEEIYKNKDLLEDYLNEIELIKETQIMEERGIVLNDNGMRKTRQECELKKDKDLKTLSIIAGEHVNPDSPGQMQTLLYKRLHLPILKRTGSGAPSTDQYVISDLRFGLENGTISPKMIRNVNDVPLKDSAINRINETRKKQAKDAVNALQSFRSNRKGLGVLDEYNRFKDDSGAIHPNIGTNAAKNGREKCDNPNLQNVGKGAKENNPFAVSTRRCFGPRNDYILLAVDESGIELRLIIERAQDQAMIDVMKAGDHPHIVACKLFYGDKFKSKEENKNLYGPGKNSHFCICYGGSKDKFTVTSGLSNDDAGKAYDRYINTFPDIANLASNGMRQARKDGYIINSFGRKFFIEHDKPYAWLNYYISATAAGILKRGQVSCGRMIKSDPWEGRVHMLIPIHDEIIFEVHRSVFEDGLFGHLRNEISRFMTQISGIQVPLEVEFKASHTTWTDMMDLDVWLDKYGKDYGYAS